jgi:hypothetical protein
MGQLFIAAACPCREIHRIYIEGKAVLNEAYHYSCPVSEKRVEFFPRVPIAETESCPANAFAAIRIGNNL